PDADLDLAAEVGVGPLYHARLLQARPLPESYMEQVLDLVSDGLNPGEAGTETAAVNAPRRRGV
ncbi:hypothetical protein ACFQO7_25795, partial [Catellatospora aurea]